MPSESPGDRDLRASDAERERVAAQLRDHAAEGRLTTEELDERLEGAYAARTRADLEALLADLPRERRTEPRRQPRPRRAAKQVRTYLLVSALLVVIWAATGAGYFWPVWPILGWGLGVLPLGRGGRGLLACGGHRRRRAESVGV